MADGETDEVAKELARFLRPLTDKCLHHNKNTKDFVVQVKKSGLKKRSVSPPMMVQHFSLQFQWNKH